MIELNVYAIQFRLSKFTFEKLICYSICDFMLSPPQPARIRTDSLLTEKKQCLPELYTTGLLLNTINSCLIQIVVGCDFVEEEL